jgi:hypothetical protein
MPFTASDIYSVSAGVNHNNLWTPFVTKFDTSSFYNWEQDNLPLYDLDERSEYLWAKMGYPTSGVTGMALVVSATNTKELKNVFTEVSSVIAALPNPIRFPILIEVARSGDLGPLELENIQVVDDGRLEIVNRVFAKSYAASTTGKVYDSVLPRQLASIESLDLSNTMANTSALSVSSNTAGLWKINDTRAFFATPPEDSYNTGNPKYQTGLMSTDFRWKGSASNFQSTTANVFNLQNYEATAAGQVKDATTSSVYATGYLPSGLDVSTFNQTTFVSGVRSNGNLRAPLNQVILQRSIPSLATEVSFQGLVYGNWLKKVKIKSCEGPIYIRGFCVDGSYGTGTSLVGTYNARNGFDVVNSEVVLENCTATRCPDAGFAFHNSKINISRGIIAYRNYEILANDAAGEWHDTRGLARNKHSAGIRAVNSDLTVSSNHNITSILGTAEASGNDFIFWSCRNSIGVDLNNSKLHGGQRRRKNLGADTLNDFNLSSPTTVSIFYNSEAGLKAKGSEIGLDGRLECFNNEVGIEINNSDLLIDELGVENSKGVGLNAKNSSIVYNKNSKRTDALSGSTYSTYLPGRTNPPTQITFLQNAQNIKLDNSILDFIHEPDVYTKFGSFKSINQHGISNRNLFNFKKNTLPNIELTNNSTANFLNPRIQVDPIVNASIVAPLQAGGVKPGESGFQAAAGCAGGALKVASNSEATLHGSVSGITTITGPINFEDQVKAAGVYAGDNSKVNFQGPTRIVGFGVDVLAENNSTMNFTPHKNSGFLDVSGFNLFDANNHTTVELHSVRACLVANNKSTINMKDLGDYHATWTSGAAGPNLLVPDYQTGEDLIINLTDTAFSGTPYTTSGLYRIPGLFTSGFHSAGSMLFLPNPPDPNMNDVNQNQYTSRWTQGMFTSDAAPGVAGGVKFQASGPTQANSARYNYLMSFGPWTSYGLPSVNGIDAVGGASSLHHFRSHYSKGGMCVRVLKDSLCNVKNVHFITPSVNPSASFYDPSNAKVGGGVAGWHDLRIWNVADTSKLTASYCSVSSCHPAALTNMHGPSSVFASGTATNSQNPAFAFSSTVNGSLITSPVTSSISVLDHFGKASDKSVAPLLNGAQANALMMFQNLRGEDSTVLGTTNFENRGPFRIYFSPNAFAQSLVYFSSTPGVGVLNGGGNCASSITPEDTVAFQHISQGYNISAAVSSVYDFSALDPGRMLTLGVLDGTSGTDGRVFSGVFFQSELYDMGTAPGSIGAPTQSHISVMLDESALNTFANAKHNTLGARFSPTHSVKYLGTLNNGAGQTSITDQVQFVEVIQPTISPGGSGHLPLLTGDVAIYGKGFRGCTDFDLGSDN